MKGDPTDLPSYAFRRAWQQWVVDREQLGQSTKILMRFVDGSERETLEMLLKALVS